MSSFTQNKSIEQPASGSYANAWAAPVNADWEIIDTAFGGTTTISVTGVAAGTYALSLSQYQPPNIEFSGTMGAQLSYELPSGVGGFWSVWNNTTGSFILYMEVAGGGSVSLAQGQRTFIVSDGTNLQYADTAYAATVAGIAQTNAEAFATTAANTAQSNAETYASNASNLSVGTASNTVLPNVGTMTGVTIAPDPGTTPSGTFGQLFLYY